MKFFLVFLACVSAANCACSGGYRPVPPVYGSEVVGGAVSQAGGYAASQQQAATSSYSKSQQIASSSKYAAESDYAASGASLGSAGYGGLSSYGGAYGGGAYSGLSSAQQYQASQQQQKQSSFSRSYSASASSSAASAASASSYGLYQSYPELGTVPFFQSVYNLASTETSATCARSIISEGFDYESTFSSLFAKNSFFSQYFWGATGIAIKTAEERAKFYSLVRSNPGSIIRTIRNFARHGYIYNSNFGKLLVQQSSAFLLDNWSAYQSYLTQESWGLNSIFKSTYYKTKLASFFGVRSLDTEILKQRLYGAFQSNFGGTLLALRHLLLRKQLFSYQNYLEFSSSSIYTSQWRSRLGYRVPYYSQFYGYGAAASSSAAISQQSSYSKQASFSRSASQRASSQGSYAGYQGAAGYGSGGYGAAGYGAAGYGAAGYGASEYGAASVEKSASLQKSATSSYTASSSAAESAGGYSAGGYSAGGYSGGASGVEYLY